LKQKLNKIFHRSQETTNNITTTTTTRQQRMGPINSNQREIDLLA